MKGGAKDDIETVLRISRASKGSLFICLFIIFFSYQKEGKTGTEKRKAFPHTVQYTSSLIANRNNLTVTLLLPLVNYVRTYVRYPSQEDADHIVKKQKTGMSKSRTPSHDPRKSP